MNEIMTQRRVDCEDMLFVSFPGDESGFSGCLAAGRGFFHINSQGGAEPCPFSPYANVNDKDTGVAGALHSGLLQSIRESGLQPQTYDGGCVFFERISR